MCVMEQGNRYRVCVKEVGSRYIVCEGTGQ